MEESGSVGLEELLTKEKDGFLKGVDFCCISDSYWLGTTKPCLTFGLRGICSFQVEVTGIAQDLHSGVYGGVVHEPLADLFWVMSQLTDVNGNILIPGESNCHRMKDQFGRSFFSGIYDDVAPMTDEERKSYETIDFDVTEFRDSVGAKRLPIEDKSKLLQRRWREPR